MSRNGRKGGRNQDAPLERRTSTPPPLDLKVSPGVCSFLHLVTCRHQNLTHALRKMLSRVRCDAQARLVSKRAFDSDTCDGSSRTHFVVRQLIWQQRNTPIINRKKIKTRQRTIKFSTVGRRTSAVVDVVRQGPSVEISVPSAPSGIRAFHPRRRGRKSLQLSVVGA